MAENLRSQSITSKLRRPSAFDIAYSQSPGKNRQFLPPSPHQPQQASQDALFSLVQPSSDQQPDVERFILYAIANAWLELKFV